MFLYYFTNSKHGIENIERRRVKISRLSALNDPFELLPLGLQDKELRRTFEATKKELDQSTGIICLSRSWNNPLMWGHYADSHRGVCLGFEVSPSNFAEVTYKSKRLNYELDDFAPQSLNKEAAMHSCLTTKFSHWKYEKEWRLFVSLDRHDHDGNGDGNYFLDFGGDLMLKKVIVGCASEISRQAFSDALTKGQYGYQIDVFKARPAFRSFTVVKNRAQSLWK